MEHDWHSEVAPLFSFDLALPSDPPDHCIDDTIHHTSPLVRRLHDQRAQEDGRKCHILTDTLGLLMIVGVSPANTQTATPLPGWSPPPVFGV
jgi:hypothetical protein